MFVHIKSLVNVHNTQLNYMDSTTSLYESLQRLLKKKVTFDDVQPKSSIEHIKYLVRIIKQMLGCHDMHNVNLWNVLSI